MCPVECRNSVGIQSSVENPTKTTNGTSEHVGPKLAKLPCLQSIPKRLPQTVFSSSIAMSRAAKAKNSKEQHGTQPHHPQTKNVAQGRDGNRQTPRLGTADAQGPWSTRSRGRSRA